MIVRDLIEHLAQFDGEMPVLLELNDDLHDVNEDGITVETVTTTTLVCEDAVVIRSLL
jgi:hypothetical protein